mgnify:CR=1 FL=1
MILLQASPVPSFGIFETLTQYGALGVITLGLGAALWFLLKRQIVGYECVKNGLKIATKGSFFRFLGTYFINTICNPGRR